MAHDGETGFTHLDGNGRARMVDISGKTKVRRSAAAAGRIALLPETLDRVRSGTPVIVRIGTPLSPEQFSSAEEMAEDCWQHVCKLHQQAQQKYENVL